MSACGMTLLVSSDFKPKDATESDAIKAIQGVYQAGFDNDLHGADRPVHFGLVLTSDQGRCQCKAMTRSYLKNTRG